MDQKSTLAPSLCCHDSELITFASPTTGCHSRGASLELITHAWFWSSRRALLLCCSNPHHDMCANATSWVISLRCSQCHSNLWWKPAKKKAHWVNEILEQRRELCTPPSTVMRLCTSPCPGRLHPGGGGSPVLGDTLIMLNPCRFLRCWFQLKKKVLPAIFAICRYPL